MARRKKPENETYTDTLTRQSLESIANKATRSEKVSWDRKMENMVTLISNLTPIEDKMLELLTLKNPIIDEISILRKDMVQDCVHPFSHLISKGLIIECKFCNKHFKVLSNG